MPSEKKLGDAVIDALRLASEDPDAFVDRTKETFRELGSVAGQVYDRVSQKEGLTKEARNKVIQHVARGLRQRLGL